MSAPMSGSMSRKSARKMDEFLPMSGAPSSDLANAISAYAVRTLGTATNAVRARRSSDNSEQDIPAASFAASLGSFVSSNSAYAAKWYDQVGAADASQSTTTLQPRLVNAGAVDDGLVFDGSNDYIDVASHPLSGVDNWTVCYWVNLSAAGSYPMVVSSPNVKLDLRFEDTTCKPQFAAGDTNGANGSLTAATALSAGVWKHVAFTYAISSRTLTIYLNGVADASTTLSAGAINDRVVVDTSMRIGARGTSFYLPATLKDLRFYSVTKTAPQIAAIYGE